MNTLENKINILNKNEIIPGGLNIPIDMRMVDARATDYQYSDYKYASNESYNNKAISIKFIHTKVDKGFWITIFEGATHREEDTRCVIATFEPTIDENYNLAIDDGTVYNTDCITFSEEEIDGLESIKEIILAFKCKLFDGDETELYTTSGATFMNNSNVMLDVTSALLNVSFFEINDKVSKDNPNPTQIREIHEKLITASSTKLYEVTVVHDCCIKTIKCFLEREEAEVIFINYCKEYYNGTGLEMYAERLKLDSIEQLTLNHFESYFNSDEWHDINDLTNVSINIM